MTTRTLTDTKARVSLEAALTKIAAEHDFNTISVARMPVGERVVWTAMVHWDGYTRNSIPCAAGNSHISIADALVDAIDRARENRLADVAIPALEMEQAA